MPGQTDPWIYNNGDENRTLLQVSIFPEEAFGATTAFDSTKSIVLTASEAAVSYTPLLDAKNTAKAVKKTTNAIAMGVSVAALAVSASLF